VAPLTVIVAGTALGLSPPVDAAPPIDAIARWQPLIAEASRRFGVSETSIARVIRAESAGRTMLGGRPITSRAGAIGLMQLMPTTWAEMRARLGLGGDPYDPHDNILAGTFYLRRMIDRFGVPGAFAAYNAGPARYADHLATGRALPAETVAYLASVGGGADMHGAQPTQGIFVAAGVSASVGEARRVDPLFAIRTDRPGGER
jgi:soluble lytic murein transglycosylase-like protein